MCTELRDWVSKVGLLKATEAINQLEESKGRKKVTYQAVQQWLDGRVPALRVLSVEAASGVPRHKLHPEIYPQEVA